jgi:hypothetical protein
MSERITILITLEMKNAILYALDALEGETFQQFMRRAILNELARRGKDLRSPRTNVVHALEDENIPDWAREEAAQLAHNQASLPRRSERKS